MPSVLTCSIHLRYPATVHHHHHHHITASIVFILIFTNAELPMASRVILHVPTAAEAAEQWQTPNFRELLHDNNGHPDCQGRLGHQPTIRLQPFDPNPIE